MQSYIWKLPKFLFEDIFYREDNLQMWWIKALSFISYQTALPKKKKKKKKKIAKMHWGPENGLLSF